MLFILSLFLPLVSAFDNTRFDNVRLSICAQCLYTDPSIACSVRDSSVIACNTSGSQVVSPAGTGARTRELGGQTRHCADIKHLRSDTGPLTLAILRIGNSPSGSTAMITQWMSSPSLFCMSSSAPETFHRSISPMCVPSEAQTSVILTEFSDL